MFDSTFSDTINVEFKFTQRQHITFNTQQNKKQTKESYNKVVICGNGEIRESVKKGTNRIGTMSNNI